MALLTSPIETSEAQVAIIRDTSHLEPLLVSKPLLSKCKEMGAEVVGTESNLSFDDDQSFLLPNFMK